ncbi:hypothetical protein Pla123a_25030 [Posidoniimonas polymericola]|uniref:Uncharacterized protein n=1 Tax=Posidoniimonas polymericola TaxID=2528002 RepID=A0A5C5YQC9_9BACT|nr:hypothetical protein [Posidoniimonas polymericola]TWT77073.1 hypothetical protein Pla123a_25030 [Posidoniimonas polymericola]
MPDKSAKASESRVDPPHAIHRATAKTAAKAAVGGEVAEAPAALELESSMPIDKHAAELAQRLQQQQDALQRRAAELDARELDLQAKVESAKLWFEEQNQLVEERPGGERDPSADAAAAERAKRELEELRAAIAKREQELDARQAELYQEIESFTNDRGKHGDRIAELDRRQQAIQRREEEFKARQQELNGQLKSRSTVEAELERQRVELESQQQELQNQIAGFAEREAQLAARQAEIQLAIKRYEALGITERRIAQAESQSNESHARAIHLDEAEAMLAEEKRSLQRERSQLNADRQAMQQQHLMERRKIEEERVTMKQEIAHDKELLSRRAERIDDREAALERLQVELQGTQREVLEMRLATEETWAQLTGALAPASLTRSIAQVRARLSDHYEQTLREMEERRVELEGVSKQLGDEQSRLEEHGRQLLEWSRRRDEEIEKQAARLIARERELDRQQGQYESLEVRWNHERSELRARIRDLLSNMRHGPSGEGPLAKAA